jgi:hypothetical protein
MRLGIDLVHASGDEAADAVCEAWMGRLASGEVLSASLAPGGSIDLSVYSARTPMPAAVHDLSVLIDAFSHARMTQGFEKPLDLDVATGIADGCLPLGPFQGRRAPLEALDSERMQAVVGPMLIESAGVWELWERENELGALRRSIEAEAAGRHVVAVDIGEWDEDVAALRRLEETTIDVGKQGWSMHEVFQCVQRASGVPVVLDWADISSWRGYRPDSALEIGLGMYSGAEMLERVWRATGAPMSGGVWWNIVHGAVRVRAFDGGYAPVRIYHLGDLVADAMRREGARMDDAAAEQRCFDQVESRMESAVTIHAYARALGGSTPACAALGWRVSVWANVADHMRIEQLLDGMRRAMNAGGAVSGNPATSP